MSTFDPIDQSLRPEHAESPLLRLGNHAIGTWRAAEEIGDPRSLATLRPLVERIGRASVADVTSAPDEDDTKH